MRLACCFVCGFLVGGFVGGLVLSALFVVLFVSLRELLRMGVCMKRHVCLCALLYVTWYVISWKGVSVCVVGE